jgi:hypothetical protein
MLRRMQTTETDDLVPEHVIVASFVACLDFGTAGDGSPVCAHCGWLDAEHPRPDAEVRSLPRRHPAARPQPKRLAS